MQLKINDYSDIVFEWIPYNQFSKIKETGKNNFLSFNWICGNEKIDSFIQDMQLKIDYYSDIVFEWIPYDQFNEIKEIGKGGFATVYSAIWKSGPLYLESYDGKCKRDASKKV